MEDNKEVRKKSLKQLEQEMYFDQCMGFLAKMIVKYADKMQPIIEAKEAELRAQGSSLEMEWEKAQERYERMRKHALETGTIVIER